MSSSRSGPRKRSSVTGPCRTVHARTACGTHVTCPPNFLSQVNRLAEAPLRPSEAVEEQLSFVARPACCARRLTFSGPIATESVSWLGRPSLTARSIRLMRSSTSSRLYANNPISSSPQPSSGRSTGPRSRGRSSIQYPPRCGLSCAAGVASSPIRLEGTPSWRMMRQ